MLRKLIVFAITSGLAAKLYRSYLGKRSESGGPTQQPAARRRRAGTRADQT
jgi:hypothetical protein